MRRFVILAHDWPQPHFDFMLEEEQSLRTWRLEEAPGPGARLRGVEIAPHRLVYLDYEGSISGGRGTVTRWDFGRYISIPNVNASLTFLLAGRKIEGNLQLFCESGHFLFDFSQMRFEEMNGLTGDS